MRKKTKQIKILGIRGNVWLMKCKILPQDMFSSEAISVSEKEENEMGENNSDLCPSKIVKGLPEKNIASGPFLEIMNMLSTNVPILV